jgi:hypothetical protein
MAPPPDDVSDAAMGVASTEDTSAVEWDALLGQFQT